MAKSSKEGTAANRKRSGSEGHRFETQCYQGLITMESTLRLVIRLTVELLDA